MRVKVGDKRSREDISSFRFRQPNVHFADVKRHFIEMKQKYFQKLGIPYYIYQFFQTLR